MINFKIAKIVGAVGVGIVAVAAVRAVVVANPIGSALVVGAAVGMYAAHQVHKTLNHSPPIVVFPHANGSGQ